MEHVSDSRILKKKSHLAGKLLMSARDKGFPLGSMSNLSLIKRKLKKTSIASALMVNWVARLISQLRLGARGYFPAQDDSDRSTAAAVMVSQSCCELV